MTTFKLILREIFHRKLNFLLSLLVIVMAVALFVCFFTTGEASKQETIRLTRDMGFNLRIIPRDTDMEFFWTNGFSEITMPEDYLSRFLSYKDFSFAHLTAILHKRVSWQNRNIILTGISPEIEPSGKKKTPMSFSIQPGTAYIGYELAKNFNLYEGDEILLFEKPFTIIKTLSETGSNDDIRIYAQLSDVQEILRMREQINEIKALHCLCIASDEDDPLVLLRKQLSQVLPDTKLIMNRHIAVARESQRLMLEEYFAFIIPFILVVCAAWTGILAQMNSRERRYEIGILRAVGYSSGKIALLFLGKAVIVGLIGAAVGYGSGTFLALKLGPGIFKVTANAIKPYAKLLYWSLAASPAFVALSVFIPTMIAVTQDPAVTLGEE